MAVRHEYQGAAAPTMLSSGIISSDVALSVYVSTNWPTGSIGPFLIVVDQGKSNEEKILVGTRSGLTLSSLTRGVDGTTAQDHGVNASVKHIIGALDIDLVNRHAADTTQDDHTQYVHNTTARTITADHAFTGHPTFTNATISTLLVGNSTFTNAPVFDAFPTFPTDTLAQAVYGAGELKVTAGSTSPPGVWLECNGQSVLRASYPALFTAIGVTYGSVDGTHFNVPNLQDSFPVGSGASYALASVGGGSYTLTGTELPNHTHTVTDPGHTHSVNDPGHTHGVTDNGHIHGPSGSGGSTGFVFAQGGNQNNSIGGPYPGNGQVGVTFTGIFSAQTGISINSDTTGTTNASATTGITVAATGTGSAFAIVPKYVAVKYWIKAH